MSTPSEDSEESESKTVGIRRFAIQVVVAVLVMSAQELHAAATDNIGAKWHWSGAYVYYNVASYTLPAGFQPALDNAAAKWTYPHTTVSFLRGADLGYIDWAQSATHTLWYGTFPAEWSCPASFIACTFVQGEDTANHHLRDVDTVWDSNDPYTNTCPWWYPSNPDIESVFLHEFGHWGTLGHTSDGGARMQGGGYYTCAQNLAQHDIDSMNANYVH
jgi:hypothetical protein